MSKYEYIRRYYNDVTPMIIEASKRKPAAWFAPYTREIDWIKTFTPIEYDIWTQLRVIGSLPMYPQYPVGRCFADFGNPFFKIAIECDGKEYHKDKLSDYERDRYFSKLGWSVYRISGSDCFRILEVPEDEPERRSALHDVYMKTGEGLVKALAIKYCGYTYYEDYELQMANDCLERRLSITIQ